MTRHPSAALRPRPLRRRWICWPLLASCVLLPACARQWPTIGLPSRSAVPPAAELPANDPTRLSSQGPVRHDVFLHAGRFQESLGNRDAALEQYQRALELAPRDLPTLIAIARLHDRDGRFDLALRFYRQAVEAHPASTLAWNDLALCHARQRDLAQAVGALRRAVELAPDDARYRNNLAKVLVEASRYDEAFNELVAVHPPAVAHFNLAHMLEEREQHELAWFHCTRALRFDPGLPPAIAMAQRLGGTPDRAAEAPGERFQLLPADGRDAAQAWPHQADVRRTPPVR